ncbi:MAG: NAD-dependent 4,6-dehydratase LegB [Aestuariivirga sp.]
MQNKKILVTGADGFIGSHIVESLVDAGYDVRAFVYYNSFGSWGWLDMLPKEKLRALDVFSGDIRDQHCVRTAMMGCGIVMHLAALIAIPYSYQSPATYIETNVTGTLNIVQAAHELSVERVVVTSTSEVYGTAHYIPIDEKHPIQPQSPYSASKIGADAIALSFHKSFGTPVAILRPFNTYGPRQSARAVIPTVISQIASGQREIKLGALHPTRDFTFVKDTAKGFIAAAACDAAIGEVTNIGSGFEISILETAQLIAEVMGVSIEIESDAARLRPPLSEVERLFADTSKAQAHFGWAPEYSTIEGFRRGLAITADWFQDPANLARYKSNVYNI